MQRRGDLVRNVIPNQLRELLPKLQKTMGPAGADLIIQGRDGTGPRSQIPWIRIASKSRSPNARTGWYLVFLFAANGRDLFLWLGHGSTRLHKNSFIPRSEAEISALVKWGRMILGEQAFRNGRLQTSIDLASARALAQAYEKSLLYALHYNAEHFPSEHELKKDIQEMSLMLRALYDAADLGVDPETESPDVDLAENILFGIAKGARPGGQGFGLTAKERAAVEGQAMKLARIELEQAGFDVTDKHSTKPYDFLATRNGIEIYVEVKGTTAPPGKILITANEVSLHQDRYPNNALIIVHSIALDRSLTKPRASAGEVIYIQPWHLEHERLRPICFSYNAF